MDKLRHLLASLVLVGAIFVPLSASAVGVPFGGLVTAVIPCNIGPVPALYINVLGFGFVQTIGTIPYAYYIPHPGQYILGKADSPVICKVGTVPLPPALRIQMFGVSI